MRVQVVLLAVALMGCRGADWVAANDEDLPRVVAADPSDQDGDGLTLAEELELGSDPFSSDTDGDTYLDGWEVHEGTNPLRYRSRIYEGFWPYWLEKEAQHDTDDRFPRLVGVDPFGERVDSWDYGGAHQRHELTVFYVGAFWCWPSTYPARWLSESGGWMEEPYGRVRLEVDSGQLRWVTLLADSFEEDSLAWADEWPHPQIAVLADVDDTILFDHRMALFDAIVVDRDLQVVMRDNVYDVLAWLAERG